MCSFEKCLFFSDSAIVFALDTQVSEESCAPIEKIEFSSLESDFTPQIPNTVMKKEFARRIEHLPAYLGVKSDFDPASEAEPTKR